MSENENYFAEKQYLAGEHEAEIEAVRKEPLFEGLPCDRCSELYGHVTMGCPGCEWMNRPPQAAA